MSRLVRLAEARWSEEQPRGPEPAPRPARPYRLGTRPHHALGGSVCSEQRSVAVSEAWGSCCGGGPAAAGSRPTPRTAVGAPAPLPDALVPPWLFPHDLLSQPPFPPKHTPTHTTCLAVSPSPAVCLPVWTLLPALVPGPAVPLHFSSALVGGVLLSALLFPFLLLYPGSGCAACR